MQNRLRTYGMISAVIIVHMMLFFIFSYIYDKKEKVSVGEMFGGQNLTVFTIESKSEAELNKIPTNQDLEKNNEITEIIKQDTEENKQQNIAIIDKTAQNSTDITPKKNKEQDKRVIKKEQKTTQRNQQNAQKASQKTPQTASTQHNNSEAGFSNQQSANQILQSINQCYPEISKRRGEEGVARIKVYIGKNNNLIKTELLESTGFSRLDNCALKASQNARYKSKIVNGKTVESTMILPTIRFKLTR